MGSDGKTITIIGGGLAGLTLGIGLRQRGVPVMIYEAGDYPRHRVCGEFISGRGLGTLQRLGLLRSLEAVGVRPARTAAFSTENRLLPAWDMPVPALCISRLELDDQLARRFRELGGELRCGVRWAREIPGEGFVRASGRRPQTEQSGWRWYGIKAHARKVELKADLEMHFSSQGYVGLCRLPGGVVNVCGLFRSRRNEPGIRADTGSIAGRFSARSSDPLGERLRQAAWDERSICAVAGLSYRQSRPGCTSECVIGDALAMIPPVTGNGMSMAFESAELALEPLLDYAQGRIDWRAARVRIRQKCRNRFAWRLWCARKLQRALFFDPVRNWLLPTANRKDSLWRVLFGATR